MTLTPEIKQQLCNACKFKRNYFCRKHGDEIRRLVKTRATCEGWGNAPKPKPPAKAPQLEPAAVDDIRCDVVIPYCQKNLQWLAAAVDSILNQAEAECIVHLIADGFTVPDDPAEQYANHPQVRLYRNEKTIGPYRTMNRLFDRLETDFIAVQDSDDIAMPHRIAHSIEKLRNGDVYGGAMRQFVSHEARDEESLRRLSVTPVHTSGHSKWRLCPNGNILNGTLVMRKTAYQRLNGFADLMGSGDLEFATRCHRSGATVVTDDEIVGLRRLHSESLSHGSIHGDKTASRNAAHETIQQYYEIMVPGCDFRQFGSLSKERYERHRTKPVGNLIEMENLELHVSHACNLACQQCTHFSNFNHKGMISPEEADKQMGFWSDRLLPRYFSLLGGEPTLNPQLCEIVRLARKHFPHSKLQLVTNGFNLQRHPELPAVLEETGCNLEISVHHDSAEYQAKLDPVKQLVADWENAHALRVNWRTSSSRWKRAYKGHGATMMPYEDNQPEQSWKACGSKWCPQIHDGKLWKCPQMAYLSMQAQKHGLNEAWNPYLAYTPLEPTCTTEELREFVNRKSESCCGMCPANPELFQLPSPLKGKS